MLCILRVCTQVSLSGPVALACRGHEHECLADPWESAEAGNSFSVMQPGSSGEGGHGAAACCLSTWAGCLSRGADRVEQRGCGLLDTAAPPRRVRLPQPWTSLESKTPLDPPTMLLH